MILDIDGIYNAWWRNYEICKKFIEKRILHYQLHNVTYSYENTLDSVRYSYEKLRVLSFSSVCFYYIDFRLFYVIMRKVALNGLKRLHIQA